MRQKTKTFTGLSYGPVVNNPQERENAIKNNLPARFEIESDLNTPMNFNMFDHIYNLDFLGKSAVNEHNGRILRFSEKYNLDPDPIRSVMFAENARGHKVGSIKFLIIWGIQAALCL